MCREDVFPASLAAAAARRVVDGRRRATAGRAGGGLLFPMLLIGSVSHPNWSLLIAAVVAVVVTLLIVFMLRYRAAGRRELQATLVHAAQALAGEGTSLPLPAQLEADLNALANEIDRQALMLRGRFSAVEAQGQRLTAALTHMADGVVISDERGIVYLINPAAAELLECTPSWAEGRPAKALARHPELLGIIRACLSDASNDPPATLLEFGPFGKRRTMQVVASRLPIPAYDQPRVLLILQDVTALRQAEVAKRDLVANVSHDLRTPVTALKALVETLVDGAMEDPQIAAEFLGRMQIEVDRLAQLVEELLELARIESGHDILRLESIDLGQVVLGAAERLRPQAERQGVNLVTHTTAGLPRVAADSTRIAQVVVNLVHNAIKFTPPGGRIEVSVAPSAAELIITVADTGIGIAPQVLPRLFERFYKTDRARTGGGTGLGLAIAKHLVHAHRGRIWVESAGEGQGARFFVSLPTGLTMSFDDAGDQTRSHPANGLRQTS